MNDLEKSIKLFFFALLVGVLVSFVLSDPSYASGDCKGQSCNDGGDVSVDTTTNVGVDTNVNLNSTVNNSMSGGDTNVSTGGNRALALSNNMGDVDIADCLGSTQFGTPLFSKQKLVINNVCLADFYLKMGKYDLAAMALCNIPGILKEFDSEEDCEYAHDFAPVYEAAVIVEDYDQEYRMEQQMRYDELEQKIENIEPKVTQKVIQKPFLSTTQRTKLQAILDEDDDES